MKFDRIGLVFGALAGLIVVMLIPVAIFGVTAILEVIAKGITEMIDFIRGSNADTATAQFSRYLMYSFTISFIVFIGGYKLSVILKENKNMKQQIGQKENNNIEM